MKIAIAVLTDGKAIKAWVNDVSVANLVEEKIGMMWGFMGLQVQGIKKGSGPYGLGWKNFAVRELKLGP